MPNHYTTEMTLRGPQAALKAFEEQHIKVPGFKDDPDAPQLDFNTVIPMPACLDGIESSTDVKEAVAAFQKDPVTGWKYIAKHWGEDTVQQAMKSIKAVAECGHPDWYSWSNANWGTKWNSYQTVIRKRSKNLLKIKFDTAWCPPMPVIKKLKTMHPDLKFSVRGRDESERKWEDLND